MAVEDLMADMVADVNSQLGSSVTLRVFTAGALNTTTGKVARTSTDYTLTAVKGPVEPGVNRNGAGVEDRTYTFDLSDLAHGVYPGEGDHIIDNGITRPIVPGGVGAGASGQAVVCRTRRDRVKPA